MSPAPLPYEEEAARTEKFRRLYVDEGRTLQEIGDENGLTRERVRQILAEIGVIGRSVQRQRAETKRAQRDLMKLLRRCQMSRPCRVCGAWVLRASSYTTCSKECADVWIRGGWYEDPERYEGHRRHVARSILRHPDKHTASRKAWAERMLSDNPPPPNRHWKTNRPFAVNRSAVAGK